MYVDVLALNITSCQWRIQDFPEEGVPTPWGVPTYDIAKFSQNLHEIERIWIPRGGARPKFYYVDPPSGCSGRAKEFVDCTLPIVPFKEGSIDLDRVFCKKDKVDTFCTILAEFTQ